MFRLYSQRGRKHYDITHYVVDTVEDIKKLPPYRMGDTAYVISTSQLFMLGSKYTWYQIKVCDCTCDDTDVNSSSLAVLGVGVLGEMILGKEE